MTNATPSRRAAEVEPFLAMAILAEAEARAARGARILRLEVGEPTEGAPPEAFAALARAAQSERFGYGPASGRPALKRALSALYRRWHGLEIAPERIVLTAGASGAFQLAFLACFDQGARIAMATPGYPCYRNIARALDLAPVSIEADAASRFQPTPALLDAAAPLDGLVIASPANPTGAIIAPAAMAELADWARRRAVTLISDEIYHGLHFDRPAVSALAYEERAIVINSFSKFFGMTGWRLGWMVAPEDLAPTIDRLAQNLFLCPSTPAQAAALGALEAEAALGTRIGLYRARRDALVGALERAGAPAIAPPDGAFYVYADVSPWTDDSLAFCRRALDEIETAFTPGLDFDPRRGGQWIRLSCAGADASEAAERLENWLGQSPRR